MVKIDFICIIFIIQSSRKFSSHVVSWFFVYDSFISVNWFKFYPVNLYKQLQNQQTMAVKENKNLHFSDPINNPR